jgi:hypothetical protein
VPATPAPSTDEGVDRAVGALPIHVGSGRAVVASPGYLDLPRGREAGAIPAQSRYGDHPSDGVVEVRSPGPRSMLYLREKGQATMRTSG